MSDNIDKENCTVGRAITQAEIDQADELALASQLIAIHSQEVSGQTIETVDARTLHRLLEVKTRFRDWFPRRVEEYQFIQDIDFIVSSFLSEGEQADTKNYYITLDMAKELAMVEHNDVGRQIRRYFIERERRYNNIVTMFLGERRPTSKRYALEFYQHVSRVYAKKIPTDWRHSRMMGGFIDRYVYRCLPREVRDTYNTINPRLKWRRRYPLHQLLTVDMDHQFLKARLKLIVDFCKACGDGDIASFKRMINTYDRSTRTKVRLPHAHQIVLTPLDEAQIVLPFATMAGATP